MTRTFIASVLAMSLAATGMSTAPARAGSDEAARILFGAVTLAIIGAAINDQKKKKKKKEAVHRSQTDHGRFIPPPRDHRHGIPPKHIHRAPPRDHFTHQHARPAPPSYRHPPVRKPQYKPYSIRDYVIPQTCVRNIYTPDGYRAYVGKRCVKNTMRYAKKLPRDCERVLGWGRDKKVYYSPRCLRRNGYDVRG